MSRKLFGISWGGWKGCLLFSFHTAPITINYSVSYENDRGRTAADFPYMVTGTDGERRFSSSR